MRLTAEGAKPEISVVILTSARETRLAFALEALANQTLDRHRFEVLVVREPQPGPTMDASWGLNVRFLLQPVGGGLGAARNVGWRAASSPLVAFTDDDCRPAPGWLESLLRAQRGCDTFLQGRTEPDPDERHLVGPFSRSQTIVGPSAWYQTCNIAYPRALLERLGGFDERYTALAEDTDLALRATELGAHREYVDAALVWHAVHLPSLFGILARVIRWGDSIPRLLVRHPAQRRAMYWRVFWKESHGKLVVALAGAALARVMPWAAVLAALPYLQYRVGLRPRRPRALARRCAELPAHLLIDATETAVLVWAAARHRVILA